MSARDVSPSPATGRRDPLLLDSQLCFKFYAASNLVNRLYAPVLSQLGLTYPQYLAMLVLWECDDQTVGALAARLYLDSGTITPLMKRLESAGLVSRMRDPADERRVRIRLTQAGRDLREAARSVPAIMLAGQDEDRVDALRETLGEMVDTLAAMQAAR
ncbi:MarR family winged helix-turn-helix transcriptional regulator [Croceicoccus hydrothermalis]|uniref:MarR family winged helix-turn-helix transcriptional regulator n=1 Tax=Croceicoccus hydrothermalis TaxID=2867964 RepID=UPI001EFA812E|nr:MarR family transcriptional regulator [Croceicoccus hydrothermalis]